jgi:hypothetical protein
MHLQAYADAYSLQVLLTLPFVAVPYKESLHTHPHPEADPVLHVLVPPDDAACGLQVHGHELGDSPGCCQQDGKHNQAHDSLQMKRSGHTFQPSCMCRKHLHCLPGQLEACRASLKLARLCCVISMLGTASWLQVYCSTAFFLIVSGMP